MAEELKGFVNWKRGQAGAGGAVTRRPREVALHFAHGRAEVREPFREDALDEGEFNLQL